MGLEWRFTFNTHENKVIVWLMPCAKYSFLFLSPDSGWNISLVSHLWSVSRVSGGETASPAVRREREAEKHRHLGSTVCLRDVQRDLWPLLASPPEPANNSVHNLTHKHTAPEARFLTQTHTRSGLMWM